MNLFWQALLATAVVAAQVGGGAPPEPEKGAPDQPPNAALPPEGKPQPRRAETRRSRTPAESPPGGRESGPRDKAEKSCEKRQAEKEYGDSNAMKVVAKQAELQTLLQQLYQAEAAVKMEAGEVARTQEAAEEAEAALEDATNKVRMLSAELRAAQESAAAAAMRAHTAQLQLSAHDQLMFTARQRVDALSAQMVSVQADLASAQRSFTLSNSSLRLEEQGANNRPCPYVYRDLGAYTPPPPPSAGRNKAEASGTQPLPPPESSYPFKWGDGSGSVPSGGGGGGGDGGYAASSPERRRPLQWKEAAEYAPRLLYAGPAPLPLA